MRIESHHSVHQINTNFLGVVFGYRVWIGKFYFSIFASLTQCLQVVSWAIPCAELRINTALLSFQSVTATSSSSQTVRRQKLESARSSKILSLTGEECDFWQFLLTKSPSLGARKTLFSVKNTCSKQQYSPLEQFLKVLAKHLHLAGRRTFHLGMVFTHHLIKNWALYHLRVRSKITLSQLSEVLIFITNL